MIRLRGSVAFKSVYSIVPILLVLLLSACSNSDVDEDEAMRLVEGVTDYPKPVFKLYVVNYDGDRPLLQFLLHKGYLTGDYKSLGYGDNVGWVETDSGDEFIKVCTKWRCEIQTYEAQISGIREILVDEERGTARVKYEVTTSPTDLYSELRNAMGSTPMLYRLGGENEADEGTPETEVHELTLRKWDGGWRVAG